jgi:DNA-binding response OmpR family regulator
LSRVVIVTSDIVLHRVAEWILECAGHEVTFAQANDSESLVLESQPHLLVVDTGLPTAIKADLIARLKVASSRSKVLEILDGSKPTHEADGVIAMPYMVENFAEEAMRLLDGNSEIVTSVAHDWR